MRAYSASSEEDLRARELLKDWAGEGFLTEEQYQRMEQETACELRRTNIFLRLVLFLFTLIIAGASAGLFFQVFLSPASPRTTGVWLLIFAAISYAAAEVAVSRGKLYRHGIEEALAVCSVGFLVSGLDGALFGAGRFSAGPNAAQSIVPAAGAVASLWIWRRWGLPYAYFAAMLFAVFLPGNWTGSNAAQHVIVAGFYAAGLTVIAAVRKRHCFDYLNAGYSIVEAILWLGVYLAINLQLSSVNLLGQWMAGSAGATEFAPAFYWTTWVLTWCLPPAILARGIGSRDRLVAAVGALAAILTLVTNKPYLGWQRHTWDPMLLGAVLVGVALFLRRWIGAGPEGVRRGYTARRLSGKDKHWMNVSSAALGLALPQTAAPGQQSGGADAHFGGGDSGGGGATSDF